MTFYLDMDYLDARAHTPYLNIVFYLYVHILFSAFIISSVFVALDALAML